MKAKAATREQIENFRSSQRIWREREAEARERECAELARWLDYRAARDQVFERAAAERRQAKNTAVLRLAADLRRDQEEAREKEEILQEWSTSLLLFLHYRIKYGFSSTLPHKNKIRLLSKV
jgi:hypothetical protein